MPYSKDISTYPEEYWQIPAAITSRADRKLTIQFARRSMAMSWRGQFNHFKQLVQKIGFADTMLNAEEFGILRALIVKIQPTYSGREEKFHKDEPATILIEHADYTDVAIAVRAALAEAGHMPPPRSATGYANDPSLRGAVTASSPLAIEPAQPFDSYAAYTPAAERSQAEDAAVLYLKAGAAPRPPWVCARCSPDNMCWHKELEGCDHEA